MKTVSILLFALCLIGLIAAGVSALSFERKFARALIQELKSQLLSEKNFELSDQESFAPQTRCTNVASTLNVRSSPGGRVVKFLRNNVPVIVYGTSTQGGRSWARIGTNQWISSEFLKMSCTSGTTRPTRPTRPTSPTRPTRPTRPARPTRPTQPTQPNTLGNTNTYGRSGDKASETLAEIFKSEGKCQNWANDSGNRFQGRIGYTCMGVIPAECWNNRNSIFAPLYSGFNGHPSDFCRYAYNKNTAVYKDCAAKLYTTKYFAPGGCSNLPMPAFYVCADIAVNSGTGRSKQYIRELGGYNGQDAKSFARQLNERHRQDYKKWGAPGTKNNKFLRGWLARADARARYINNY